ncbi:MAG: FAD-dependent thymidylate synthase [Clostridia bacterium]|nr:FAD-dependent thymidylate synthase [Clostridia bacterium]
MNIDIIASTKPGFKVDKHDLDIFCGHVGGVCYMPHSFQDLLMEDQIKTERRIDRTMGDKHHSVFEHGYISLYLEDIPKLMAMVLNNEKVFVTSEKSARYTKMQVSEKEQYLYDKWYEIILDKIAKKYTTDNKFFNKSRREKLAQENARYMISSMTKTSMVYTVSYRQLNYLCQMFNTEMKKEKSSYDLLKPYFSEFVKFVEDTGYLDTRLCDDGKNRELSLIKKIDRKELFGDVYSINYLGTTAQLGQAQRHRTIDYEIDLSQNKGVYVPKILSDNDQLVQDWIKDVDSVKDLMPQGLLFKINERSTLERFVMKMKERCCSFAQLEIDNQTRQSLKKYMENVQDDQRIYNYLEKYSHGSRCSFPDYKCSAPCGFDEGITGERLI